MNPPPQPTTGGPPGFYGKVPSKGDFVSRRLGRGFLDGWDGWLQPAIACSQEQLGQGWTDIYLTSPLWRFCLGAGTCGADAMVGVLMPSVDRVGRYFPLTIAAILPGAPPLAALPTALDTWFDWAENTALSCLEDDFDVDRFDSGLAAGPPVGIPAAGGASSSLLSPSGLVASIGGADPVPDYPCLLDRLLGHVLGRYSLWWTTGSERMAATLVACTGLPRIGGFAAFLDGQWTQWGWNVEDGSAPDSAMVLIEEKTA